MVITVPIIDDFDTESSETFKLKLFLANFDYGLQGELINIVETSTIGEAIGTILDDESRTVTFAQSSYRIDEAETNLQIQVNSSVPAVFPIVLTYNTVAGTATADEDFIAVSNTDSAPSQFSQILKAQTLVFPSKVTQFLKLMKNLKCRFPELLMPPYQAIHQ